MKSSETINVYDSRGFVYEVTLEYKPHFGFTTAYYKGRIIDQVQLNRILQPHSDLDWEWENYEQELSEWRDEIITNMKPICEQYFNRQQ